MISLYSSLTSLGISVGELNIFVDPASGGGNTRTLEFSSNNLGKEIDLLLMFTPPKVGTLYVDLFPVVWSEYSLHL